MRRKVIEFLNKIGVGYYRRTVSDDKTELKGPYPTRGQANPYGEARLSSLSISAEFRFRKPRGTISPAPIDLERIR